MPPINKLYPIEIEHVLIFVVLPTISNTNPILVMGILSVGRKCLAYTYT
jgi:hypothetical protein